MKNWLYRMITYAITSCLVMVVGLCFSFRVEHEGPGAFMGYVGLFGIYTAFGLPLCLIVAITAEWSAKSVGSKCAALACVVLLATLLFLKTDNLHGGKGYYFMSDLHRAPIFIGRSLDFLNPRPQTIQSNVATYFPLLAIATFFLPMVIAPIAQRVFPRRPGDSIHET